MVESRRSFSTFVALGVLLMAILGYVVGVAAKGTGHAPGAVAPAALQRAPGASALFQLPAGWRAAGTGPRIPGLAIANQFAIAAGGRADGAGLVTGQLAAGHSSPLPAAFVAALQGLPATHVVSLSQTEAFEYSGVHVAGFDRLLTIYVIPASVGPGTVLACYAPAPLLAELRTCEQVATTLRPVGHTGGHGLTPDPAFAAGVSAAIGALDSRRVAMRQAMHLGASGRVLGRSAVSLAGRFAVAAASLASLRAPAAAEAAEAELAGALKRGHDAYGELAVAASASASASASARYEAARARVYAAESEVDAALANFVLLGYGSR
jgi:hypothetical protein